MLLHRRSRRRRLVLLRSSVAPKPQSGRLPSDETISVAASGGRRSHEDAAGRVYLANAFSCVHLQGETVSCG